jgi:hypothetical protein
MLWVFWGTPRDRLRGRIDNLLFLSGSKSLGQRIVDRLMRLGLSGRLKRPVVRPIRRQRLYASVRARFRLFLPRRSI